MALAIGQHVSANYAGADSTTTAAITTSTTTNFVIFTVGEGGTGAPTISDSKSNTWTQRATVTCPGGYIEEPYHVFTCIGATGGSSHTFTASKTGAYQSIFVVEITGTAAWGEVASATLTADPKVTAAVSAAAGSALIAFSGGEGQSSASWGGSFTVQDSITSGSYWQGSSAARIVSSASSYTAPCTTGNGTLSAAFLVELTDAGGGGPTYTLTADGGSYALAGAAAGTLYNRRIAADGGLYSITGTAAATLYGRVMVADAGAYALTGTAAGTVLSIVMPANAGSYALTGAAAGTLYNRVIAAASGTYSLTGADATLTYTPAGSYTLTCDPGAYSIAGAAAATLYNRALTSDPGTYNLTGTAAATTRSISMDADAGSYALTGTAASGVYSRIMTAGGGNYVLSGSDAVTSYSGAYVAVRSFFLSYSAASSIAFSSGFREIATFSSR